MSLPMRNRGFIDDDGVNREHYDFSSGDMQPAHDAKRNIQRRLTPEEQVKANFIQEMKKLWGKKLIDEMDEFSRQVLEIPDSLHKQCSTELEAAQRELIKLKAYAVQQLTGLEHGTANTNDVKSVSFPDQPSSSSSQDSMDK